MITENIYALFVHINFMKEQYK